jgi:hypothetical protein
VLKENNLEKNLMLRKKMVFKTLILREKVHLIKLKLKGRNFFHHQEVMVVESLPRLRSRKMSLNSQKNKRDSKMTKRKETLKISSNREMIHLQ